MKRKAICIFCGRRAYGKTICDNAECERQVRGHLPEPTMASGLTAKARRLYSMYEKRFGKR